MTALDLRRGFIDSNIWLYALLVGQNEDKTRIAKNLTLVEFSIVSIQVINEVCVNLIRKNKYNEEQIRKLINSFYANHLVVEINKEILLHASDLRSRHAFSFWDSLIAASALSAGAEVLYSEDMQDDLTIENKLKIVNPFN